MKLRNRLTLISSSTFGIIFLGAALLIYLAFYNSSERVYFNELKNTSLLAALFYLEKDELPQYEHSAIREEFRTTIQSRMVAVYNSSNEVEFGELYNDSNITPARLDQVRKTDKIQFKSPDYFYYAIYYPDNQGNFVVVVKVSNSEFKEQTHALLLIMLVVLLGGLTLIFLLSKRLSNLAYRPIAQVVKQINQIDYTNLEQGVTTTNTNDEVEDLIRTYNKLLTRLSHSFLIQKNFVNYVSHEFKTPLAAIAGNLEVFAQRDRSPEEYRKVAEAALENIYKIEDILSNLLLMSGLKNAETADKYFRIDELIWNIKDALEEKSKQQQVPLYIELAVGKSELLLVKGNETLLQLALFNLVENAMKYSHKQPVEIKLLEIDRHLEVQILDSGEGISEEDLKYIGQTFYRGKNVGAVKGSGIGLSLSQIILDQHQIQMQLTSQIHRGTQVYLKFPKTSPQV